MNRPWEKIAGSWRFGRRVLYLAVVVAIGIPSACQKPESKTTQDRAADSRPAADGNQLDRPAVPAALPIPTGLGEPVRWLEVLQARPGSSGAWATGNFLAKRNKIEIHTNGVARFTLDISKMRPNWQRKVIIGIDGINSELRKRDFEIYEFVLDAHGRWQITEP